METFLPKWLRNSSPAGNGQIMTNCSNSKKREKSDLSNRQEAQGPRVAHLSDIATADMQMLCNSFPILSSQLMIII